MSVVTRGDVNLNYLFRYADVIGAGNCGYLLQVPEFRERMSQITISGMPVDERVIIDVLQGIHDDCKNGRIEASSMLSLPTFRRVIRKLEKSIADS